MWNSLELNINSTIEIDKLLFNTPIYLKRDNLFLSCAEFDNEVNFYCEDDGSGRQLWIIERSETNPSEIYIHSKFTRKDGTIYLGFPNLAGPVYLYTSKTQFTKWKLVLDEGSTYNLKYAGYKYNKSQTEIVVSRYNEDLRWLRPYNDIVTFYNKGTDNINYLNCKINLENKGREGDTYLYHIITNYSNLAEKTIFAQGEVFDHNRTILYAFDNFQKHTDFQPLGMSWRTEGDVPPHTLVEKYKTVTDYGLQYLVIKINSNLEYCDPYYFYDVGLIQVKNSHLQNFQLQPHQSIINDFLKRVDYFKGGPIETIEELDYTWSALFSVSKANIRKNTKDIYERIKTELTKQHADGGSDGYVLEKLWVFLLNTC
jgi:hypothetical protein